MSNKECPRCGFPMPPENEYLAEDGREMRKDGWGVLRDKGGNKIGLIDKIGTTTLILLAIWFLFCMFKKM